MSEHSLEFAERKGNIGELGSMGKIDGNVGESQQQHQHSTAAAARQQQRVSIGHDNR